MKTFKKVPVVSIILGVLIIAYAVAAFIFKEGFFSLSNTVGNLVIGVGLFAIAVIYVLPKMTKNTSSLAKTLRIIEFTVLLVGAVIGFILPLFASLLEFNPPNLGNGSLWFGIALVMDGGITLYLGAGRGPRFFVALAAVIFGTWIYATNFVDRNIEITTFIALLAVGLYLLIIGLYALDKKKK